MAQSQQESGGIQDLYNEIAFQRVLLSSIDETVVNWEELQDQVKEEIESLIRQVKDLQRSTTSTASASLPSSASERSQQTAPSSSMKSNAKDKASFQTPKKTIQGMQDFFIFSC
jgi:uncharacterized coiled-coil protein SlyX